MIAYPFAATDHRYPIKAYIDGILTANGEDFEIYVNPTTGNDANAGTQAAPLKTLDAAIDKVPFFWTGKCRVWLAAGDYTISRNPNLGGPLSADADPFLLLGTMVDSGMGTLTDAGGSTTTVVTGGVGMTVDAYRGFRIRYLTGARATQTRQIVSNTATAFTLQGAISGGAPSAGDTFVVEKPGSNVTLAATSVRLSCGGNNLVTGLSAGLYALNVIFAAGTSLGTRLGRWMMDSCWIDFASIASRSVNTLTGMQNGLLLGSGISQNLVKGAATNTSAGQAGVYVKGGVATCSITFQAGTEGIVSNVAMDQGTINFMGGPGSLLSVNGRRTLAVIGYGAVVNVSGGTLDGQSAVGPLLTVRGGAIADFGTTAIVLQNSSGDALLVENARVNVGSSTGGADTAAVVTGTGNVGYGIRLGSQAFMVAGAGTTVTGTAGDIIVGATTSTHANLTAATFVTDANFLSRIARAGV